MKWWLTILMIGVMFCNGCELGDGEDDSTEITVTGHDNTIVVDSTDGTTINHEDESNESTDQSAE